MNRSLDTLHPKFKPIAIELLARLTEAGILVLIVNTFRTAAEQAHVISTGNSWVSVSMHQSGMAIDVAPYEIYQLHGPDKLQWNSEDPIWQKIGLIGEKLGLRWGGRWKKADMGHFEYVKKADGFGTVS